MSAAWYEKKPLPNYIKGKDENGKKYITYKRYVDFDYSDDGQRIFWYSGGGFFSYNAKPSTEVEYLKRLNKIRQKVDRSDKNK